MNVVIDKDELLEAFEKNRVTFNLREPSDITPEDVYEILCKNSDRLASTKYDIDISGIFD